MKVLFFESKMSGHHVSYLKGLLECNKIEGIVISNCNATSLGIDAKYTITSFTNVFSYLRCLNYLFKIIKSEKPDLVHFVYGDTLYRFVGLGLGLIHKKTKLIITFHQVRRSFLRNYSLKRISNCADRVVVHTQSLKQFLGELKITNVNQVEYPHFSDAEIIDNETAKKRIGIINEGKVFLALGGTRYDKGLDILLDALKYVTKPFQLVIAGEEQFFKREFIMQQIEPYKERVHLLLRHLTEDEFSLCISASDVLVLPYRRSFDGASGPLGESVRQGKEIIGPSHGSLKATICENHLGEVFESENYVDLSSVISRVIDNNWSMDSTYTRYRESLSPERFVNDYYQLYCQVLNQ